MDNNVIEKARRFLGIEDYPGNLFNLFKDTEKIIKEKKIILFKKDIDKLSGFIGYNNNYTIICINNNRSIGHQNFTLAHELGHMFLHIGISMSDSDPESAGGEKENEANIFAKELIYPKILAEKDCEYAIKEKLLLKENWGKLAEYINSLCCKYCTSFTFTFNRLFENSFESYEKKRKFYTNFKKCEIGKFDNRFPETAFMYNVKNQHEFYKPYYEPYIYMKKLVAELITKNEIGLETGDAMINRYNDLEG